MKRISSEEEVLIDSWYIFWHPLKTSHDLVPTPIRIEQGFKCKVVAGGHFVITDDLLEEFSVYGPIPTPDQMEEPK